MVVWTTVEDIAGVVARAIEYEGEWPAVGGISGSRVTVREMLQLGEAIGKCPLLPGSGTTSNRFLGLELPLTIFAGRPFTVEWLKKEDIEAEKQNPETFAKFELHTASPEEFQKFLKFALQGILIGISRGAYDVTDEWNKILPDYKFTQVEEFVKEVWGGK